MEKTMEKEYHETQRQVATTGRHKLAEEWSVFLGQGLTPNGKMDFRNMNSQGELRGGKHTHGSIEETIDGQATSVTLPDGRATFAVLIQTRNLSATYNGVLLVDTADNLAIGGFFKFDTTLQPREVATALAQDEGVWVITKP